jgi:hypothetical protein
MPRRRTTCLSDATHGHLDRRREGAKASHAVMNVRHSTPFAGRTWRAVLQHKA